VAIIDEMRMNLWFVAKLAWLRLKLALGNRSLHKKAALVLGFLV